MGTMKNMGESMSKKPAIPLLVILVVTLASLGMIAIDPPSFDMDESSFMPDNDITRASTVVEEAFTSSASVFSTIDASGAGGDIFTKSIFLDVLTYEQSLYGMEYTGTDGQQYPYYNAGNTNGFTVVSPVDVVAGLIFDPTGESTPTYDQMIATIQGLPDDSAIKYTAYRLFNPTNGGATGMARMITTDLAFDDVAQTASAKGCMVSVVVVDTLMDNVADGVIGFESDVSRMTDAFTPTESDGLAITAVCLNTMIADIGDMASDDMSRLVPVAMILIVVVLLLMYRDLADTLIGLAGLIIAIIWTFGISTLLGIEMSTIAIAVPILIMGLGIDYGLHLVFRYREERMSGKDSAKANGETMVSVGEALVLATVTTVIAFLSYLTSSMSALADFGLMCAIGIICAFAVMLLLVPPMQAIRDGRAVNKGKNPDDAKRYKKVESKHGDIIGKVAGIGGRIAAKSPWAVIGVTCVVLLGFGYSATNLTSEFDMYDFIPEDTEAYDTITYLSDNYDMTTDNTSVLIYASGWDLDTLKAIENTINDLDANHVSGLYYGANGLHEPNYINLVLWDAYKDSGAGGSYKAAYGALFDPATGDLLPDVTDPNNELILALEGAFYQLGLTDYYVDMSAVVGEYDNADVTRIVLNITSEAADGGDVVIDMMDGVNAVCAKYFGDMKYVTTGSAIVLKVNMDEMNKSQMSSLIITLALVLIILTLVMYYTDRSWLLGTMATIPTLVSVVLVWGTMALLGISLNVLTLTIASLTVGMGVTYGIHIAHRYVTDLRDNGCEARDAIMRATRETGKGVFSAALTTAVGFGVIGFSGILPMQQFGMITAMAIIFGYIGATFILPALLVIWGEHTKPKACKAPKVDETNEA